VSRNILDIILIHGFGAQETFPVIINVEYFSETQWNFFGGEV